MSPTQYKYNKRHTFSSGREPKGHSYTLLILYCGSDTKSITESDGYISCITRSLYFIISS